MADPSQLQQVLMNLVVNARDAMPRGGRIVVQTHTVDIDARTAGDDPDVVPGPYVQLTVSDTGTGMSEETRSQIFEPFFTTKERGKGTGLGLATVYGVIRQSAGFIQVDSEVGKGTTFRVYLPRTDVVVLREAPKTAVATPLRGSETVLIVEDQEHVRALAVETLEARGYTVLCAADGREALEISATHPGSIDVLLTDVVMPGIDGRALAERLQVERPGTRVIYMSGYAEEVIGDRGVLEPGLTYLAKPFALDALAATVRAVMAHPIVRTVLVVDDDADVRALFREFLGGTYNVLMASDGREAVEIVRASKSVDLVITDLVMPNQEGIETIVQLRTIQPLIKVVAVSGAFGGQFLNRAERLGANASLLKPVSRETLHRTVRQVLN
jgi:CheY-like chemotaxis protein